MPSLFSSRSSKKEKEREKEKETAAQQQVDRLPAYTPEEAPSRHGLPAYSVDDTLTGQNLANLTAAFTNLSLSSTPPAFPEPNYCLAHLKLLTAFNALKREIGHNDGLFGIEDRKVEKVEDRKAALDALKEKRWTLYVARAVDRFQDWWLKVLFARDGQRRITCRQLAQDPVDPLFPVLGKPSAWNSSELPPLDVLMVWHTFMLNPRDYFQDCVRFNLRDTWATGIPWAAVNEAIDADFNYDIPEAGKIAFTNSTGRQWDNTEEGPLKFVECPKCDSQNEVSWTTCMDKQSVDYTSLTGTGFGDRDFVLNCNRCDGTIDHQVLRVGKFKTEAQNLVNKDWPMSGTVLGKDGTIPREVLSSSPEGNFASRLVKQALASQVQELITIDPNPTVEDIKLLIEAALKDTELVKKVNVNIQRLNKMTILNLDKISIRKLMSCIWDNSSIFSMDLGSAVIRQSLFVDKMVKLDWLHSPTASNTMQRLLIKYGRFIDMMAENPGQIAVPTLDVDLAWHTHQLSPQAYYNYTLEKTKKFVDHDDKISEDKISDAFEWTSETYQKAYNEVYSECTCWYCEVIRYRHSAAVVFGQAKHDKPVDDFYLSGRASQCHPSNSAHISTHNVVRINETAIRAALFNRARESQRRALDNAYLRACTKAKKKGRKPPVKDDYVHSHWDHPYFYALPFLAVPIVIAGGVYYASEIDSMHEGNGQPGVCAAGSCGTTSARGTDIGMAVALGGGGGCGGGCGGGS